MPTVYVQIQCPAADKAAIESDLSAYGSYPLAVEITTYPGDPAAPATHYGANVSCVMGGPLDVFMQTLPGTYPGCNVQTVQRTSPYYKAFNAAVNWVGWLNGQALQPRAV
jgi:hypothetical protein